MSDQTSPPPDDQRTVPVVLTVAGSDSSGGAGIQADLITFADLGVYGTTAVTCVTAQSLDEFHTVTVVPPDVVREQIRAASGMELQAVKTGMLYDAGTVRQVAEALRSFVRCPIVVDPVVRSSSGAPLITDAGLKALEEKLLPLATVITPNLHEVRVLTNGLPRDVDEMEQAAWELNKRFDTGVLITGGHLPGPKAVDVFCDGKSCYALHAERVASIDLRGTGCRLSSAISASLARGCELLDAVRLAKDYVLDRLLNPAAIAGGRRVLVSRQIT